MKIQIGPSSKEELKKDIFIGLMGTWFLWLPLIILALSLAWKFKFTLF